MEHRLYGLRTGVAIALAMLALRLTHLQVLQGAAYRTLADRNRLRLIPEPAPRGLILDRHNRIMAASHTVFRVALVPQDVLDLAEVVTRISPMVRRSSEALERAFRQGRTLAFLPAVIVPQVPKPVALELEEERWRLPGLLVQPEVVRHYPSATSAAHVLGHLSQPTAEELPLLKQYGVQPRELVGRVGIERLLDHALRGRTGGVMVEVNHRGQQVRILGRREPAVGASVTLTIDVSLQSLIEQSFSGQPGACVVLNPSTGAVLAMISQPSFSPEAFVEGSTAGIQRLLDDSASPLMNRATIGAYQPGSIMKLVTASAALEHRLITPSTTITCSGSLTIGDRVFHCWNRDGHGPMNLSEALQQSCNVYFMQLGRRLGVERLRTALQHIGFSRRTGWPMEEHAGHLPRRRLTEGEVALLAIGQGEILVTVLQAAVMASVFANDGWLVHPWVVSAVDGRPLSTQARRQRVGWAHSTFEAVRNGMRQVVQDPLGTGHRAFSSVVAVAGKTGTAQTHVPGRTHGWFVGYCPLEQPRAALAVLAEYGGSGGDLPAEIARTICEYLVTVE